MFIRNDFGILEQDSGVNGGGSQTSDSTGGAGDQTGDTSSQDKGAPGQTSSGEKSTATDFEKIKADYEHLLSVHTEMKSKLQKREEEEKAKTEKALKEQGKYKELYEATLSEKDTFTKELEAVKAEREELAAALDGYLNTELQAIPDNFRNLIPEGNAAKKLAWIANAKTEGLFTSGPRKKGDDSPPAGGKGVKTLEDYFRK